MIQHNFWYAVFNMFQSAADKTQPGRTDTADCYGRKPWRRICRMTVRVLFIERAVVYYIAHIKRYAVMVQKAGIQERCISVEK